MRRKGIHSPFTSIGAAKDASRGLHEEKKLGTSGPREERVWVATQQTGRKHLNFLPLHAFFGSMDVTNWIREENREIRKEN